MRLDYQPDRVFSFQNHYIELPNFHQLVECVGKLTPTRFSKNVPLLTKRFTVSLDMLN